MRTPDNYDMWEHREIDLERRLARCPVCEDCGERIQDEHYFDVEGDILCEDCMIERYRRSTEEFVEL